MIKKMKIFHICLAVAFILSALLYPSFAYADNSGETSTGTLTDLTDPTIPDCSSAQSLSGKLQIDKAETDGIFDNSILTSMQEMMRKLYKALSMLFMMGHGLMCYSTEVAYICLGVKSFYCVAHLPNFNFLISGLVIYITGGLMCMAIGMYFVDISLKLGFAVVFLPVSIGLWPFKPTHNKFSENLSIVIRNGMLFMLVAIGASYAVILIINGVFPTDSADSSGWSQFWSAIENKKTNVLIENFSLDSIHTLVVAFCIIFGFKILASSVNDYLNYFFQDSAFGSESPMHHVGTQVAGMAANYTVKPAMSFAKDVATHQTGRAIAGVGSGISKLGSQAGRQQLRQSFNAKKAALSRGLSRAASHAVHPVDTLNSARAAAGKLANKGIQKLGNVAKSAADLQYILMKKPLNYSERERQARNKVIASKIDKFTKKLGNQVEHKIAHGQLMSPQRMEKAKQLLARGGAALANKTGKGPKVTASQVRQRMHQAKIKTSGAINQAMSKTGLKAVAQGASHAAHATQNFVDNKGGFRDRQINKLKDKVAGVGASAINKVMGKSSSPDKITAKDVRAAARMAKGAVKTALHAADNMESIRPSKILSKAADKTVKATDAVANAGLNIAKEPFKAISALALKPAARLGISALGGAHDVVRHPQRTYRAVKAFAKASKAQKKSIVMKKVDDGGQILFGDGKKYINDKINTVLNQVTDNGELLNGPLKDIAAQSATEMISAAVTYKSLKAMADAMQNVKDTTDGIKNKYNSLESERSQKGESAPKFYIKRAGGVAGKVVMRTAVTGAKLTKGTAEDTAKAVGSLLENFGKALGDNRQRGQSNSKPKSLFERIAQKSSFEQMLEDDETDELRKKEQQAYYKTLEYEDS